MFRSGLVNADEAKLRRIAELDGISGCRARLVVVLERGEIAEELEVT